MINHKKCQENIRKKGDLFRNLTPNTLNSINNYIQT